MADKHMWKLPQEPQQEEKKNRCIKCDSPTSSFLCTKCDKILKGMLKDAKKNSEIEPLVAGSYGVEEYIPILHDKINEIILAINEINER